MLTKLILLLCFAKLFLYLRNRDKILPLLCSIAIAFRELRQRYFGYSIWEEVQDHKWCPAPARYSPGNWEVHVAFDTLGVWWKGHNSLWPKHAVSGKFALLQGLQLCSLTLCRLWKSQPFTFPLETVVLCLASCECWWQLTRNDLVRAVLTNALCKAWWWNISEPHSKVWQKGERGEAYLHKVKAWQANKAISLFQFWPACIKS